MISGFTLGREYECLSIVYSMKQYTYTHIRTNTHTQTQTYTGFIFILIYVYKHAGIDLFVKIN